MWRIGDVPVDGRVVLGPMSGYTTCRYREFMSGFGVATAVTEMVSAPGILNNPKDCERYLLSPEGCHTGAQVFGGKVDAVAKAAEISLRINPELRYFDINMGCPVKKVIRTGAGSAMLDNPRLCGDMVRAVKKSTGIPVTAKIRLGKSNPTINFHEVVEELLSADVDAITIHSRTVDQKYAGKARHELLTDFGKELPVPLIISGDIYTLQDARDAMDITGATAVMVARGGVGNPFLVTQIDRFFKEGTVLPDPLVSEQVDWCLRLIDMIVDESGPEVGLARLRSVVPKFMSGIRYSRDYRRAVTDLSTDLDGIRRILGRIRDDRGDLRVSPGGGWSRDAE